MLTVEYGLLGVAEGQRILDVGCGGGRHSWGLYSQFDCRVCALDLGREDLKKTRYVLQAVQDERKRSGKWVAVQGDAMKLPLKDASFDRVLCSEVLEHVRDDRQSMAELVRVLKPGGFLAISVPTYLTESVYWKISKDYCNTSGGHVRKYRADEIANLLRQNDLRIYDIRHKHALHSVYWLLRCIFGIRNEKALIPSLYHKFLVWDLKTRTAPVRLLDDVFNHIFPKSIVVYARKGEDGARRRVD